MNQTYLMHIDLILFPTILPIGGVPLDRYLPSFSPVPRRRRLRLGRYLDPD